jgi:hypothetical protein
MCDYTSINRKEIINNTIVQYTSNEVVNTIISYLGETKFEEIFKFNAKNIQLTFRDLNNYSFDTDNLIKNAEYLVKNNSYIENTEKNYILYIDKIIMTNYDIEHTIKNLDKLDNIDNYYIHNLCPKIYIARREKIRVFVGSATVCVYELNSNYINILPDKYITSKKCMHAYNNIHENIIHIPEAIINHEMTSEIVNINPQYFKSIPDNYKTQEMCNKVVYFDPSLVRDYIPTEYINKKMYKNQHVKVKEIICSSIAHYINKTVISVITQYLKESYYEAIIQFQSENLVEYSHYSFDAHGLLEDAEQLAKDKSYIKNTKKNLILYIDKNKIKIDNIKRIMNYIADANANYVHNICPKIYIARIEYHNSEDFLNKKQNVICIYELNSNYINILPDKYKTSEKCLHAYTSIHENIKYMPKNIINYEISSEIFDINPQYFKNIPNKYKTQEMCNKIVYFDPNIILTNHIPKRYITDEMCNNIYNISTRDGYKLKRIEID